MKKSLLTILCTLLSMFSWAQGTAAGDGSAEPYAVLTGDTLLTFFYDDQKSVRGGMSVDHQTWAENSSTITKVVFDDSFANCTSLTSTAYWFSGMSALTSIEGISNLKTDNVTDMSYMFSGCSGLTNLDLSNFNTSNVTNMSNMFSGCSSLTSLDLSHFNTANVTDMSGMFAYCANLNSLDLSNFDTSNVTNISEMFSLCTNLVDINLSGWKNTKVKDMQGLFSNLQKLENINLTNFKTDSVTNMSSMFYGCYALTSLDLSGFNTANVTNMNLMFEVCSGLTNLDVSNFNTANVTAMYGMFYDCSSLTSLDVSSFKTDNVTDMSHMFWGCSALKTIYAGSEWSTANVSQGEYMFRDCTSLVGGAGTVYDANHIDHIYAHIDGGVSNPGYFTDKNAAPFVAVEPYAVLSENNTVVTFYYDDQKTARGGVDINNSYTNHYSSAKTVVFDASFANYRPESTAYWFNGLKDLETFIGLEYLNTSNVTSFKNMFKGCRSLKNLDLSGFDASKVTDMTQMFEDCSSLKNLNLRNFNTDSATNMGDMFCECSSLESLDLSSFNIVNVTKMSYMFAYCSSLKTLDLSSFNTANVTNMEGMFHKDSLLTTIYVGESWSTANVSSEEHDEAKGTMFQGCIALVGGAGTPYDSTHVDYTYAHIDGGENNPGYFTEKNASYNEAYGVLSDNNTVLTLYYDGNKSAYRDAIGLDEMMQNQQWMQNRGNILTVNFDSSFANCNPTSTAYWFAFCNSLTAINGLQYLNTEFVTNMEYMFHMCPALSSIDLSHFRAKSLTNMNAMFGGCSSLTSLDLSGFFTFTVTNMNYLFSGCTNLKTIYVNKYDWSTESVTAGDGVFENCTSLVGGAGTTFNDSHIDYTYARIDGGPNSQTPGYFTDIDASASVVAPEFRFEGDNLAMTTETQNASIFYKVAELPSMAEAVVDSVRNSLIVTPDGQQSTYYEHPFELKMAAVVKAIAVADNATGTIVSDTTTMVYDYEAWVNLKAAVTSGVDLYDRAKGNPNVDAQLLEDLQWALNEGDMIYNQRAQMDSFEATHFTQRINELCAQIEAQMAAEDEPYAVLSTDGLTVTFYYDTQKNARGGIDINNSYLQEDMPSPYGTATTAVFDASFANYRPVSTAHWFQHCRSLTSITNIEYLNTVNVTEMTAMFHKCSSLSSLNLSNFNTSNVTDMTAMFGDCSGLTSLDLSNFNTTNVTGMNGMFAGCSGLTNIDLSNFNTTNVMDMSLMFHSCSGLTSLDLSNFNTAKVTNMESMFRYCSELKTIYIGNEWSTNAVEFGSEMFDGCTNLVGGAGTVYDANHTDHTYAHIDGGENNPGYFTDKNPVEASYYDHVLYVGGSVTLAEAMQKFGTNNVVETIAAIVWNSSQAISTSELQVITNPNLLIYVQDASLAPANRDNVVINGFAKNVVLSDVTSGNNNFYCPEEFTAEAISYTRNFQQQTEIGISRGWESIALPFDVQTIMHEKNGVLSPFGSSEGGKPFWLRQMSDNGLVQAIEIHANRPYLISMPNSTDYPAEFNQPGRVTFSSLNVRVPVTEEEAVAMADSTIVLIPTFQRMEQSDWIYALNVGETRAQYPEGSVFEQGLRAVRPFEAFTVHNNNQSNPAPRYIAINEIGNGTLGIDATLVNREEVNSEEWYSLDGRKLQGKPAQKGIYIQNGKKVIIK